MARWASGRARAVAASLAGNPHGRRQADLEPQQGRNLLEDGHPDRTLDEPLQDGIGDQVGDPADLEQEERDVQHADQEGEREDQREAISVHRHPGHGRRGEHDHGRVGSHHEEPRAAEDRIGDERQREGVEADHGVDAEDARVRKRQRDEHGPDGGARDEVAAKPGPSVRRQPLQDRHQGAHVADLRRVRPDAGGRSVTEWRGWGRTRSLAASDLLLPMGALRRVRRDSRAPRDEWAPRGFKASRASPPSPRTPGHYVVTGTATVLNLGSSTTVVCSINVNGSPDPGRWAAQLPDRGLGLHCVPHVDRSDRRSIGTEHGSLRRLQPWNWLGAGRCRPADPERPTFRPVVLRASRPSRSVR